LTVVGIVVAILALLVVVMMLVGGGRHNPLRHVGERGGTPPASVTAGGYAPPAGAGTH
jgi:hypothetical protein